MFVGEVVVCNSQACSIHPLTCPSINAPCAGAGAAGQALPSEVDHRRGERLLPRLGLRQDATGTAGVRHPNGEEEALGFESGLSLPLCREMTDDLRGLISRGVSLLRRHADASREGWEEGDNTRGCQFPGLVAALALFKLGNRCREVIADSFGDFGCLPGRTPTSSWERYPWNPQ